MTKYTTNLTAALAAILIATMLWVPVITTPATSYAGPLLA